VLLLLLLPAAAFRSILSNFEPKTLIADLSRSPYSSKHGLLLLLLLPQLLLLFLLNVAVLYHRAVKSRARMGD